VYWRSFFTSAFMRVSQTPNFDVFSRWCIGPPNTQNEYSRAVEKRSCVKLCRCVQVSSAQCTYTRHWMLEDGIFAALERREHVGVISVREG